MKTTTRVCKKCGRERPISHYTKKAKVTCASCVAKRRRQHELREQKKNIHAEALRAENDAMQRMMQAQSTEIERLQAALTVFREPDAMSDQLLTQLYTWSQLARPVIPSEPRGNLVCSAGILASDQPMPSVPEAPQPLNNLPIDPYDNSATKRKKYNGSSSGARSFPEGEHQQQNFSTQPAEALDPPIDLDMFEVQFLETEHDGSTQTVLGSSVGNSDAAPIADYEHPLQQMIYCSSIWRLWTHLLA